MVGIGRHPDGETYRVGAEFYRLGGDTRILGAVVVGSDILEGRH